MIRLRRTTEVPRPINEVFAYTSNFGNAAQWDPGVAASRKDSRGPIGASVRRSGFGCGSGPRSIPMTYVVRGYDSPSRVRLEGRSDSVHFPGRHRVCVDAAWHPDRLHGGYFLARVVRHGRAAPERRAGPCRRERRPRPSGSPERRMVTAGTQRADRPAGSPDPARTVGLHQSGLPLPQAALEASGRCRCAAARWWSQAPPREWDKRPPRSWPSWARGSFWWVAIGTGRKPPKGIVAATGNENVAVALADLSLLADVRKLRGGCSRTAIGGHVYV